jgi:long-chain fatty acid transport protein
MRSVMLAVVALMILVATSLSAQNTDIESLSGLQFNFGNPGARSLGMGGAFLGLADDASAAEANPAGLTILRKPEFSIEARNYQEQQVLTTSGTFPNIERTAFSHYSQRVDPTFGSFVYPVKNFTFGAYYHEPLRNQGAGQVIPQRNQFSGVVEKNVPNFYLPRGGTPVSKAECEAIVNKTNDFTACLEYALLPFLTALDVQERTFGLAGAYKFGNVSIGAAARYQTFRESSFTFRLTPQFEFDSISLQSTGTLATDGSFKEKDQHRVTFVGGVKWAPNDRFSVGGSYKQGPKFNAPTFAATNTTNLQFVKVGDTTFHMPDVYGLGVSFRPIPVLTLNADAVHVTYSHLVDHFISISARIRQLDHAYAANDVTELHVGGEYFFAMKVPFALRAGYWRDPAHAIEFRGPLTDVDSVANAILYPKGQAQNHFSVGAGFAWPRFQIDFAYDRSDHYKVGSISAVTRF